MSVKKFKPLGEMVERSTLGGGIYVLASDYGAAMAREAELKQRLDTAEHQREVLAQAIADATHKAGIVADGAALDGPTLLMALNDLAELQVSTQQQLSDNGRHGVSPGATAAPPDDQDEINRLHAEFIAVDEPNNEQLMAFQDASYTLGLKRGQAHEAALQQRLNEADQRIDELERDKQRLDALEGNFWDVRHHSSALADTGDYTSGVEIIGRWMDKPHERVIGENYNENLRAAIDQAMTADAYPPARPEYPELDAALDQLTKDSPEVGS